MDEKPKTAGPGKKPRRRWFQFKLRTLLIGMALLTIPCGYVSWQAKIVRERKALLVEIESEGGGFCSSKRTTAGFWGKFPIWPNEAIESIGKYHQGALEDITRHFLGEESVVVIWLPAAIPPTEEIQIKERIPEAYIWRFK
jgi:hypothetical protein